MYKKGINFRYRYVCHLQLIMIVLAMHGYFQTASSFYWCYLFIALLMLYLENLIVSFWVINDRRRGVARVQGVRMVRGPRGQ